VAAVDLATGIPPDSTLFSKTQVYTGACAFGFPLLAV
jgi:hypothetical protein